MDEYKDKYLEEKFVRVFAEIKAQSDLSEIKYDQVIEKIESQNKLLENFLNELKKSQSDLTHLKNLNENCSIKKIEKTVEDHNNLFKEYNFVKKYKKPLFIGYISMLAFAIFSFFKSIGIF